MGGEEEDKATALGTDSSPTSLFPVMLRTSHWHVDCVLLYCSWNLQLFLFLFFPLLFRAAPAAYGSSQARNQIGAAAASLHHSHSNAGWDLSHVCDLHHSSRQRRIPISLSGARYQTYILMDTSWICFSCATMGSSKKKKRKKKYKILYGHRISGFSGIELEKELLDHVVSVYLTSSGMAILFSKGRVPFYMPPQQCMRGPVLPYPYQPLLLSVFFINLCYWCVVVFHCGFDLHLPSD